MICQRVFSRICAAGFAGVTAIAICDHVDSVNDNTYMNDSVSDSVVYYSDELKEDLKAVPDITTVCSGVSPSYECTSYVDYSVVEKVTVDDSYIDNDTYTEIELDSEIDNDNSICDYSSSGVYESLEIPNVDCSNFMFMDYRTLTDTSSPQWELQQYAWTDGQGFRRIGDDYCVALGTYYGNIGDRFRITTDKGNSYTVIEADAKGNDAVFYNDYQSWYHVCGDGRLNVVEFICDTDCLDSSVWTMGDCGVLDNIGGNVVSIEKLN